MRDSEKNVGRADHNLAGARSTAEGETQPPEKVLEDGPEGSADGQNDSAEFGSEGGGGKSYYKNPNERKENA